MINNITKDAKVMGIAYTKRLRKLFTNHPNSTDNPQGYWEHLLFSFINSMRLIWYAMLGIIHSVFPFMFAFSTSSAIIRSFKKLVESNRHIPELKKYDMLKWLDVEYDTTTCMTNEEALIIDRNNIYDSSKQEEIH
jgi:hypothetical protein